MLEEAFGAFESFRGFLENIWEFWELSKSFNNNKQIRNILKEARKSKESP